MTNTFIDFNEQVFKQNVIRGDQKLANELKQLTATFLDQARQANGERRSSVNKERNSQYEDSGFDDASSELQHVHQTSGNALSMPDLIESPPVQTPSSLSWSPRLNYGALLNLDFPVHDSVRNAELEM